MTKPGAPFDPMQPEPLVREVGVGDCQAISEIYGEALSSGQSSMETQGKSAAAFEAMITTFNERETILVLERGSEVLGWGIIKRYSERVGYRVACETSVYLRARETRKGYGTKLKLAIIERCRQFGYHHLVAKIFAVNQSSIEYNKKLGFETVGVQREIGFIGGRWQDIVIMQLILEDVPPYRPDLA